MTVLGTDSKVTFNCSGSKAYPLGSGFLFFDSGDLIVTRYDADGNPTVLTEITDYTVDGGDGATGTVNTVEAYSDGQLSVYREMEITQSYDATIGDGFNTDTFEKVLDRMVMILQQLQRTADLSLRLSDEDVSGVDPTLPSPGAGFGFRYAADGLTIELFDLLSLVTTAVASNFTADKFADGVDYTSGTTTQLTTTVTPGNEANCQVYFDGVYQSKDNFSLSGDTITFSSAIPLGVNNVEVVIIEAVAQGTTTIADGQVTTNKIEDLAVTIAKIAAGAVTEPKLATAIQTKINRAGVLLSMSANQSLADSTPGTLSWDDESYDAGGYHDLVTNPERITVPAGVNQVRLRGQVEIAIDATKTGDRQLYITGVLEGVAWNSTDKYHVKDTKLPNGGESDYLMVETPILNVNAADYFTMIALQDSGGALDAIKEGTWFTMEIIS